MKKPASQAKPRSRRLSPEQRRDEFIRKATEFFADEGFNGGTRELARRLGVTQPLLYRYFPSKDDLVEEVYRKVYLEPLDSGWDKRLSDRSRPIRERLEEFYTTYTDAIFTRTWLRIYLFSGLKGLDINRDYVRLVRDKILTRIIRECRAAFDLPVQSRPTAAELERAWVFHSGIFYYGIRKFIFEAAVLENKEKVIADAIEMYLGGFRDMAQRDARPRRTSDRLQLAADN